MGKQIGVVIIHYKNIGNVRECLDSVFRSSIAKDLLPIIVDNSDDHSAESLRKQYDSEQVVILPMESNVGFSGANNAGMRWSAANANPDTVILLNDDTTLDRNTLEILIHTLHSDNKIAAVVPKIYFSPGHEFQKGYEDGEIGKVLWYAGGVIDWREVAGFHRGVDEVDRSQYDKREETGFATGCCLALKLDIVKKLGYFDDRYFLYWEDNDLSQRLKRAGYHVIYEPAAAMWHKNAGSTGAGSPAHDYYQTRNRLLFGFSYATLRTQIFLLRLMYHEYRSGSKERKRAILDLIRGNYGYAPSIHSHH